MDRNSSFRVGRNVVGRLSAKAFAWAKVLVSEDGLSKIVFVLALCTMAFGYGIATAQFQVFPYQFFLQAKLAWEATGKLEDEGLMVGLLGFEEDAHARPEISTLNEKVGSEFILITRRTLPISRRMSYIRLHRLDHRSKRQSNPFMGSRL